MLTNEFISTYFGVQVVLKLDYAFMQYVYQLPQYITKVCTWLLLHAQVSSLPYDLLLFSLCALACTFHQRLKRVATTTQHSKRIALSHSVARCIYVKFCTLRRRRLYSNIILDLPRGIQIASCDPVLNDEGGRAPCTSRSATGPCPTSHMRTANNEQPFVECEHMETLSDNVKYEVKSSCKTSHGTLAACHSHTLSTRAWLYSAKKRRPTPTPYILWTMTYVQPIDEYIAGCSWAVGDTGGLTAALELKLLTWSCMMQRDYPPDPIRLWHFDNVDRIAMESTMWGTLTTKGMSMHELPHTVIVSSIMISHNIIAEPSSMDSEACDLQFGGGLHDASMSNAAAAGPSGQIDLERIPIDDSPLAAVHARPFSPPEGEHLYSSEHLQRCVRRLQQRFYQDVLDVDLQQEWACCNEHSLYDTLNDFDPQWHGPSTDQGRTRHTAYLSFALRGTLEGYATSNPVFIYGDDVHWRAIGFSTRWKVIYIMDSYGQSFPRHVVAGLQCFTDRWHGDAIVANGGWKIEELTMDLQYAGQDAHNCGPWAIWFAHQWLRYHDSMLQSSQAFPQFLMEISLLHGRRPKREAGPRLRAMYHALVHEANSEEPFLSTDLFRASAPAMPLFRTTQRLRGRQLMDACKAWPILIIRKQPKSAPTTTYLLDSDGEDKPQVTTADVAKKPSCIESKQGMWNPKIIRSARTIGPGHGREIEAPVPETMDLTLVERHSHDARTTSLSPTTAEERTTAQTHGESLRSVPDHEARTLIVDSAVHMDIDDFLK